MQVQIARRRVPVAYTLLMGIATIEVVLQGFLFSGFYEGGRPGFLDTHGLVGSIAGMVVLLLIPVGIIAGFPRMLRIGWWTALLAVLWNVQAHVFGYGIADNRWFVMVHIPVAFGILLLSAYLTVRAWNALRS